MDHRDGDEHNDASLRWLCKSCHTPLGIAMARAGQGRRTRQYNPPETGAASLGEYVPALRILKGEMEGDFDSAADNPQHDGSEAEPVRQGSLAATAAARCKIRPWPRWHSDGWVVPFAQRRQ